MQQTLRLRSGYAALAIGTIAVGLWLHLGGVSLGAALRDIVGDALWAMMISWWFGAAFPGARLSLRSLAAIVTCVGVELSQLFHTPTFDAIRQTLPGRLVLGSGFDPRDIAAYSLGVVAAAVLEWWVLSRRSKRP